MQEELNENDNKLLAYCHNRHRHLSDIARHIGIDVKNVSARIDKLEKLGLIQVEKIRNKVYVRSIKGDKTDEYFAELLGSLVKNGGEMEKSKFHELLPFSWGKEEDSDKFHAPMKLMFCSPPLVDVVIKINENGKKFLKEYNEYKSKSQTEDKK